MTEPTFYKLENERIDNILKTYYENNEELTQILLDNEIY